MNQPTRDDAVNGHQIAATIPDHIHPVLVTAAEQNGIAEHHATVGANLNRQLATVRTAIQDGQAELAKTADDLETARAIVAQLEADQERLTSVLAEHSADEQRMTQQLTEAGRAEYAAAKKRDSLRRGAVAMAEVYGVTPEQLEAAEPAPIPPTAQVPAPGVQIDPANPLGLTEIRPDQRPVDQNGAVR